jgi:hypothetical protein
LVGLTTHLTWTSTKNNLRICAEAWLWARKGLRGRVGLKCLSTSVELLCEL